MTEDLRQCLIYDSNHTDARLIAVEYIISRAMFDNLPVEEKKYWHSHAYEVLSGQLIMPRVPAMMEDMEMRKLVDTYGKTWCLWQTDRGDSLPYGEPVLLTSFIRDGQVNQSLLTMRDEKFGVSTANLRIHRLKHVETPTVAPDADQFPAIQAMGKGGETSSQLPTSQITHTTGLHTATPAVSSSQPTEPARVGTFETGGLDTAAGEGGTVPRTETQAYTQPLESDPRSAGSQPIAPTATGRP